MNQHRGTFEDQSPDPSHRLAVLHVDAPAPDPARVRQIELVLSQISSLPTLSPIAARLMTVAGADDADLGEIAQLIESDPGLAARILGLCRRADRGMTQRVTSVKHAVTLLGLDSVRACVLSVHIYDLMQTTRPRALRALEDFGDEGTLGAFDRPGFWRHSIAVACTCEMLAEEVAGTPVEPEEAFLAGLVHDLGTLALDYVLPRSYQRVLELAERRRSDGAAIEREVIGLDRFAAGRRLASHWRLPDEIIDAIWLHGRAPDTLPEKSHRRLVALVTLSRAFCRMLHLGWCADFSAPPGIESLCAPLGIDPSALHALADPLQKAVSDRCAILGLDSVPSTRVLLDALGGANRQLSRLTTLLQERAQLTSRQTRALAALRSFHADHSRARGMAESLACVAASAMGLIGAAPCAVIVRTLADDESREAEPWRAYLFEAESADPVRARLLSCRPLKPDTCRALSPADIASLGAGAVQLPLSYHMALDDGSSEPAAVLLTHGDPLAALGHESIARCVGSAWGAAIRAAQESESSRALSDRLADVGRSLLEAQSRLSETESMARLGEMAAGAAHEMNNPLTVISGRSQILASHLDDASDRAAAEAIAEAADDLSDLITSLHLLAAPPKPNATSADTSAIITDATALAAQRLKFKPRLRTDSNAASVSVWADRELAARALSELIVNAVEAAPERKATVRLAPKSDGQRVVLEVLDDGPGMSKRALQHAFDPFFSEKPAGRQRGLGLTRARRLVEIQGGRVSLSLREEGGTRAVIELPARRQGTQPVAPGNAPTKDRTAA